MADSATVAGVKEGLANGHALLDKTKGLNERTQSGLKEMHFEDISERLTTILAELGALATKTRELPIDAAQQERGKAEVQFDRSFERTDTHPYIDQLYADVGLMGSSHNSALSNQRALGDQIAGVADHLHAAVTSIRDNIIPTREVIGMQLATANEHARNAQNEGEKYRQII